MAVPAVPAAVPNAAPAPSWGAPETRPLAIEGPKMPRPNSDRDASTRLMARPISGSCPCSAAVNSAKKLEPIPTMTASTMTLTPDETTLPSTRSARKRSEEHTSELQSLMRNSYAVFSLKKQKNPKHTLLNTKIQKKQQMVTRNITTNQTHNATYNKHPPTKPDTNRPLQTHKHQSIAEQPQQSHQAQIHHKQTLK